MDDKRLEELAKKLGEGAENRVDVDRVAERVIARLREAPRAKPWYVRSSVLKIAAALAVLVGGAIVARDLVVSDPALNGTVEAVAFDDLTVEDLGEVLDSLTYDAPVHEFFAVTLDDLDETQLRELLATMES